MTQERWLEVIGINLTGTFRVTHTLLPLMKRRGWGRIVDIGSASVAEGVVGQTHYVSAKVGIVGFTRSLAMEVGGYGITVNIVAPGLTLTEPVLKNMPEKLIKAQDELRAIKRDEQPQDLAGTVFLLCSPDADFVSGQMLVVDGGKIKH
nr:SDR family oxidoreductase [Acidisarcina polymorpha]